MKIAINTVTKKAEVLFKPKHKGPEYEIIEVSQENLPAKPWVYDGQKIITDPYPERQSMKLSQVEFRNRLISAGIMPSSIDGMINQISDVVERELARAAWEYASEIHRLHPLVQTMAKALNKTDLEVDIIFGKVVE